MNFYRAGKWVIQIYRPQKRMWYHKATADEIDAACQRADEVRRELFWSSLVRIVRRRVIDGMVSYSEMTESMWP
jgi:hypothetical protein